ncbi:MAG: SOS response-associated peptidase family protein, partial [Bacteroidales bacterium]|nr:SOS response-associated peptidase family protein [Bacteroidales bacterium]
PFAFAGIWDQWHDGEGNIINTYAIITTVANDLLRKIGHERSPVILKPGKEGRWLSKRSTLADITSELAPYPAELMNAYPVASTVKSPRANGKELITPIGQRIYKEYNLEAKTTVNLHGMGSGKVKAIEKKYDENKIGNQKNTDSESTNYPD